MYEPFHSLSPVYYWREMHEAVATGKQVGTTVEQVSPLGLDIASRFLRLFTTPMQTELYRVDVL